LLNFPPEREIIIYNVRKTRYAPTNYTFNL